MGAGWVRRGEEMWLGAQDDTTPPSRRGVCVCKMTNNAEKTQVPELRHPLSSCLFNSVL